MGERMAFPWELNIDRPYRDEKWPFPEQRARGESTDSAFGGSAEKLDGFPVDSENWQGTADGSDAENPGKTRAVPFRIETPLLTEAHKSRRGIGSVSE
jgi:hypothetical protein